MKILHRKTLVIFIICLWASIAATAQETSYENLIFEGAGIKGLAYSGVIKTLENHHLIHVIKNVGGTSAGAITAMMVSLGYNSQEVYGIISETDFRDFNDGELFFVGGIYRMIDQYGWYKGDKLTNWLEELITAKTNNPDITFKELQEQGYKNLFITATSLNRQKLVVFSAATYPNMKIKDAIRISISIPLYFKAVFIDTEGNVYNKQNKDNALDVVVDGGIIGNYPIFLFDTIQKDSLGNEVRIPNFKTLGVRIDTDEQIQKDSTDKALAPMEINNISDYMQAFYTLVIEKLNRTDLIKEDWERTISVSSVGIGPKIKKLSPEQKKALMKSGEEATLLFLNKQQNR